jgi:polar amino acid transport system substrate-binding protein
MTGSVPRRPRMPGTRIATILVALLFVAALAGADVLDSIRSEGVIRVGVKTDYPPFGFVAGNEIVGIEPDLAADLADILDVGLELVPVSATNRFDLLIEGEVDVLLATVSDTNERREFVTIVDPDYYASGTNALVPNLAGLSRWGDLQGRLVCAVEGAFYNARVENEFGAELLLFETTAEMLETLSNGMCVAAVYDAAFIISEMIYGDWEGFSMPLETIDTEYWGAAVAPGEDALAALVSGAVVRWHMTGFIMELLDKYDVPENPLAEELHTYLRDLNPNIIR